MEKIDYKKFSKIIYEMKHNCYTNQPNYENGWSGDSYDIDEDTKIFVNVCHAGWKKGQWEAVIWSGDNYNQYTEKDKHPVIIFDTDCKSLYELWKKGFD